MKAPPILRPAARRFRSPTPATGLSLPALLAPLLGLLALGTATTGLAQNGTGQCSVCLEAPDSSSCQSCCGRSPSDPYCPRPHPEPEPEPEPEPAPDPIPAFVRVLGQASPNSFLTGSAILGACRTGANALGAANNQAFQQDCNLIVGGVLVSPEGTAQALRDLTPDQIDGQNQAGIRSVSVVAGMLRDRLWQLKGGGAASGDELSFGPLSVHFNARYMSGDADRTALTPAYDSDGWAMVGGVDYRFTDQLIGGVALNYASGSSDFALNRGDLDIDSLGVSLYGTWNLPNGFFVDGLLGYAETDYSLNRRVTYSIAGQNAGQLAKSDQDADVWNFNLGAGYTHYVDEWAVTPSVRLNYLQNKVGGFVERMSDPTGVGGSMALAVDGQTYTSFTTDLGVQITRAFSTGFGVLVPQLRVGWVHEFDNDAALIGARFVNDITGTRFGILTDEPVRDYADVNLGLSAQFANGRSAFLSYNTLLGYSDTTYHAINAGFRLEF